MPSREDDEGSHEYGVDDQFGFVRSTTVVTSFVCARDDNPCTRGRSSLGRGI